MTTRTIGGGRTVTVDDNNNPVLLESSLKTHPADESRLAMLLLLPFGIDDARSLAEMMMADLPEDEAADEAVVLKAIEEVSEMMSDSPTYTPVYAVELGMN